MKSNKQYASGWQDVADVVRTVMRDMLKNKKIRWVELDKHTYRATLEIMPRGYELGLKEQDLDPVQAWCELHNCGRRMSFDTFKFKNRKEMTMFILHWGS